MAIPKKRTVLKLLLLGLWTVIVFSIGAFTDIPSKIKQVLSLVKSEKNTEQPIPDSLLPVLRVHIDSSSYTVLEQNRKVALERGILLKDERDRVPATIRWEDGEYEASVRLKGDLSDHWRDEKKWSLRIKLKGENAIMGMKIFSLQHPKTRGYLNEWVLHRLLRYAGLIALRYDFVKVYVNGEDRGIYALEEHFDKRLIENNQKREGPIFKVNTSIRWAKTPGTREELNTMVISPYNIKEPDTTTPLYEQFVIANNMFRGFINGHLTTEEVFDIEELAKLFAIIDLTGHQHSTHFDNLRFYYNPITSRIEPIGYDNSVVSPLSEGYLLGSAGKVLGEGRAIISTLDTIPPNGWYELFFKDEVFFKAYITALKEVSDSNYIADFFDSIDPELEKEQELLETSFTGYEYNAHDVFLENQKYIRDLLRPQFAVHAYYDGYDPETNSILISTQNIFSLPVQITGLQYKDNIFLLQTENSIVQCRGAAGSGQQFIIPVSDNVNWRDRKADNLKLHFKVLGVDNGLTTDVNYWEEFDPINLASIPLFSNSTVDSFPFLYVSEEDLTITIAPGDWTISTDIVIPSGYTVIADGQLSLDLMNGAKIISRSPLEFTGNSRKILVHSSDHSGGGIMVMNTEALSRMTNVIFSNVCNVKHGNWELPGAVNFYESDVMFAHCSFIRNHAGDDFLNIFRSKATLENCHFEKTLSDAYDGDFVNGKVIDCTFLEIGNDAIDVSGSTLTIDNVEMKKVGDKGISSGEASRVFGNDIKIDQAEIALTSKDRSQLELTNISITNSKVVTAVFVKKTEYGAASALLKKATFSGYKKDFLVQKGCDLTVEGKPIEEKVEDVESLLYGAQFGKASK